MVGGLLFAGLGGAAIKDVEETRKELAKLEQQLSTTTDPAKADILKQQIRDITAGLSEGQQAWMDARDRFGEVFDGFIKGPAGDSILKTFATGLDTLGELLPEVEPLITEVADALTGLLEDVDPAGFGDWIDKLAELAGPTIEDAASILGDLAGAIDSVLTAGSDTGSSALSGIADAAERLNQYLKSPEGQEDLQEFFDWLQTDGKAVGEAIWDIAEAMADWFLRAEPLGMAIINISDAFANLYSGILDLRDAGLEILTGNWIDALGSLSDMVGNVMDYWGSMLDALGQVPGFDWAKKAADAMHNAADKAHHLADQIDAIPDVNIKATISGADAVLRQINSLNEAARRAGNGVHYTAGYGGGKTMATGGAVFGPGSGTSDSIPAWLSNGEHVITAAEVRAAGGHGAILAFRRMMLEGRGFASGGAVGSSSAPVPIGLTERSAERAFRRALDGARFTDDSGRSLRMKIGGA